MLPSFIIICECKDCGTQFANNKRKYYRDDCPICGSHNYKIVPEKDIKPEEVFTAFEY